MPLFKNIIKVGGTKEENNSQQIAKAWKESF